MEGKGIRRTKEAENEKIEKERRRAESGAVSKVVSSCEHGCVVCDGVQGAR